MAAESSGAEAQESVLLDSPEGPLPEAREAGPRRGRRRSPGSPESEESPPANAQEGLLASEWQKKGNIE